MAAGLKDRKAITSEKNPVPIICCFTVRSDSSWLWRRKFSVSSYWRPKSLASMIPEIDSVSWVMAVTSAMDLDAWEVTARRLFPTHCAMKK